MSNLNHQRKLEDSIEALIEINKKHVQDNERLAESYHKLVKDYHELVAKLDECSKGDYQELKERFLKMEEKQGEFAKDIEKIRHERDLGSQAIEAKDWKEHLDKHELFIEWSYQSQKSEIGKRKKDFEAEWQHEEEAMKKARVDLQNGNYGAVLAYTQASSDAAKARREDSDQGGLSEPGM